MRTYLKRSRLHYGARRQRLGAIADPACAARGGHPGVRCFLKMG